MKPSSTQNPLRHNIPKIRHYKHHIGHHHNNHSWWSKIQHYFRLHSLMVFIVLFILVVAIILFYVFYFKANPLNKLIGSQYNSSVNQEYLTTTLAKHKQDSLFPYRYLSDETGQIIPIVLISGFFRDDNARDMYYEYVKNGIQVVGITAYKSFPKKITDPSEDKYHLTDSFDYTGQIKNWMCCFNNPGQYGLSPDTHNLIDLSESDFYDVDKDAPVVEKQYDVIYSCLKDSGSDEDQCPMQGWNAINRNYKLALACLPIMINDYGLKVLVVGRTNCGLEELYGDKVETVDFLPYNEFQDKLRQSRILFVPNVYDASPRVVSESIIKGLSVLMNRGILCGSKYITSETGELFTDENDIRYALDELLAKIDKMSPQKWWTENYGRKRSGQKMCQFLQGCYPGLLGNAQEVYF